MGHNMQEKHVNLFIETLALEAEMVANVVKQIDRAQVKKALRLMSSCTGKIVILGVGKSGIIARKIAATLTSTGTPSLFLHPTDAAHGDMGIFNTGDVAVLISNSGETDELIDILPFLRHRKLPVIAITGNSRSTLARKADVLLDASVAREACPFNLAPTTSTTVALAIGDALAVALMHAKKLDQNDFAINHPAGRLGKRLTLKVEDLMHSGLDNPTLLATAPWIEVVSALSKFRLGAVNVVDEAGLLLGIITDGDLRQTVKQQSPSEWSSLASASMMTANPVTVMPHQLAYDAYLKMQQRSSAISVLPVIDEQSRCKGLITLHDIVKSGL